MNAFRKIRQSGFSLIEMMVAIVILAILVGLAVPSFQVMLQNTQIRNAAESVLDGIQKARAEAVKQNRSIEFVLLGDDATCFNAATLISDTCSSWKVQWVGGGGGTDPLLAADHIDNPITSILSNEGSQNVKRLVFPAGSNTITFDNSGRRLIFNDAAALGGVAPITSITFTSTVLQPADSHNMSITIAPGGAARMCDPSIPLTNPRNPRGC
ncbi:MAG: GspH/FimT family pseudopilin [Gammaproteobacteria bacterium]|nr:GspH/FimT family pseudopilin [Gammaproteobacteria bacterium]MBU1482549.1 GspH/FimT family pseudopilin [Gammaproteobacteria bacterium]